MDTTELVLLLSEVPGIGDSTISFILRRGAVLRRSADDFLALSPSEWVAEYSLRRDAAERLAAGMGQLRRMAGESAREVRRLGIGLLTLLDATYPRRLLERMDDPPPLLYAYGSIPLLEARLFAVANSNDAPEAALAAGDAAANVAVERGWVPATGHNRTPYQRPALVARRHGCRVCYVLDRGLLEAFDNDLSRELFPAARIWSPAYDAARDLTLSPFALRDHGLGDHNRRRDDLVFALADVLFLGSARPGGRMERSCSRALASGRAVYLVAPMEAEREARWLEKGARRLDPCDTEAVVRALDGAHPGVGDA